MYGRTPTCEPVPDRHRLAPYHKERFPSDTLHDVVARHVCDAACLPEKELHESWAVARKILRRHKGGPVLDLAGGHGLVAFLILLQDRRTPHATVVDPLVPDSAARLREAFAPRWPELVERWRFEPGDLATVDVPVGARLLGIHACGGLTDLVLDRAIATSSRVAVLPCCHSRAKQDAGGLDGWLDHDVAVDVVRARRLAAAGFHVHTTTIDPGITPKNRLLLGTPPG